MRLATELGPKTGVSGTSVSRFIDSAANALDGNGDKLRQTLAQLSGVGTDLRRRQRQHRRHHQEPADLRHRAARQQGTDRQFQNRLASLTSVVNDSRSDLDAALSDLSVALGEVQRFVAGSREPDLRADPAVWPASPRSWSTTAWLSRTSCTSRRTRSPTTRTSTTRTPARVTGAFSLSNFANPVYFFCGLIGAVENTTAPETAKLCAQYLGPALRLLNFNNLPFPINPYLRPALNPENIIYTDPKLAPGGAGPGDAPEPLPIGVGVHRRRRYPAASGLGSATGPAGTVLARRRGARHPVAGVVPRRTDSGAPHCASPDLRRNVDGMLLPATPAPAAPPVSPNAPLLPAEGMPPS